MDTVTYVYMEIYTCACILHTSFKRNWKENKGKLTHPTIYSPDKQTYIARDTWMPSLENWGGELKNFCHVHQCACMTTEKLLANMTTEKLLANMHVFTPAHACTEWNSHCLHEGVYV